MNYSLQGEQLTEMFEGVRLTAYQDQVGRWTIGYGHTHGVAPGDTCTQAQAEQWLTEDVQWAVRVVNAMVRVPLTQNEFDSLVDFTFNLGSGSFEHSQLLALINQGNFQAAALEFDKWDHAGGQVVAGLLRRREAEQQEFNAQGTDA
jgi:lysozyme